MNASSGLAWAMGFLMSLAGSNGNVADIFPAEDYWKIVGTQPTAETMIAQLQPAEAIDVEAWIGKLGDDRYAVREQAQAKLIAAGPRVVEKVRPLLKSDDAEIANRAQIILEKVGSHQQDRLLRQMMALRMLAQLKPAGALPAVQAMMKDDNPVLAEYARAAAAAIEGKPYAPIRAAAAAMAADVTLLPPGTGAVVQVRPVEGGFSDASLKDLIQAYMKAVPHEKVSVDEALKDVYERLYQPVIGAIGPVRLDCLTLGLADKLGDSEGHVVLIARGLYDRRLARQQLLATQKDREEKDIVETVDGVEFVGLENEFLIAMPSNELFVVLGGPSRKALPVKELAAALSGKPSFDRNKELAALVAAADTRGPLWAAVHVGEGYAKWPALSNVKSLTLSSALDDRKTVTLTLKAQALDEDKAMTFASIARANAAEGAVLIKTFAEGMPLLQPLRDVLRSVEAKRDGTSVTATMAIWTEAWRSLILAPLSLGMGIGPVVGP